MSWNQERARKRIEELIEKAPAVNVQRFADEYLPAYEKIRANRMAANLKTSPPLFKIGRGRAIVVDAVHIYVAIQDFNQFRVDTEGETAEAQAWALRFLHLHYSACDRVTENSGVQRVDFHGSRMHAIVPTRSDDGVTVNEIGEALDFVRTFREVAGRANKELAKDGFEVKFRIGIDAGRCVAIDNGTADESEPVFLGSAANHAAKLAEGDQPGIYVSSRIRHLLGQPELQQMFETVLPISPEIVDRAISSRDSALGVSPLYGASMRRVEDLLTAWEHEIAVKAVPDPTDPEFYFHYQEPPLAQVNFADLMPSNSIRMAMVSAFADLSGYTQYIDDAIAGGTIDQAVRALYVLRAEFQNVIERDFGGRKVRFIGDCIHAVVARGNRNNTDEKSSVVHALTMAGGLRSSFVLCQKLLDGTAVLGLAIGLEIGETPLTRLGVRGKRSVRIASSIACCVSEEMQRSCGHNGTKLGNTALKLAPAAVSDLVDREGFSETLNYMDVKVGLGLEEGVRAAPAYLRSLKAAPASDSKASSVLTPSGLAPEFSSQLTPRPAAGRAHFNPR